MMIIMVVHIVIAITFVVIDGFLVNNNMWTEQVVCIAELFFSMWSHFIYLI